LAQPVISRRGVLLGIQSAFSQGLVNLSQVLLNNALMRLGLQIGGHAQDSNS
jgi:hypothetical protein